MNKLKLKEYFKEKFELPNEFKLMIFRNPKEFQSFKLEPINPTHKILILGLPRKKYRRSKHLHYIQFGKILISSFVPIFILNFIKTDILMINFLYLIFSFYFNHLMFMFMDFSRGVKNINWNRRGTWGRKNPTFS